jgi:tetratricopeptide (TPR) repeat protein
LNDLGGLLYERGDFRGARKIFENLLQLRQASGDKSGVGFAKTNLADALRVQGELDRAANLYEEALGIFRDTGDRATSASVETSYAKVAAARIDAAQGKIALSRQKIKAAQAQAEKAGCRTCEAESLLPVPR